MKEKQTRIEEHARQRFGRGLEIYRVGNGLIFEHRNASHFVAEIDLAASKISVPVTIEFPDHPDYSEDEIVDHAMEQLRPRLRDYRERGYRVRESEFQPADPGEPQREASTPIFVAYVERKLDGEDDLFDELACLIERLPEK